jgi:hypothetical protein
MPARTIFLVTPTNGCSASLHWDSSASLGMTGAKAADKSMCGVEKLTLVEMAA